MLCWFGVIPSWVRHPADRRYWLTPLVEVGVTKLLSSQDVLDLVDNLEIDIKSDSELKNKILQFLSVSNEHLFYDECLTFLAPVVCFCIEIQLFPVDDVLVVSIIVNDSKVGFLFLRMWDLRYLGCHSLSLQCYQDKELALLLLRLSKTVSWEF